MQAGYAECCADDRVDAVVSLAGLGYGYPDGVAADRSPPPLLLVHATDDEEVPYRFSEDAFATADARRFLLSLAAGPGSDPFAHLRPYLGGSDEAAKAVASSSRGFLDWALRGSERASGPCEEQPGRTWPSWRSRLVVDDRIHGRANRDRWW